MKARQHEMYAVMSLDPDDAPPHVPVAMFSTLQTALAFQKRWIPDDVRRLTIVRKVSMCAPACSECNDVRGDCGKDHKFLFVYWPKRAAVESVHAS